MLTHKQRANHPLEQPMEVVPAGGKADNRGGAWQRPERSLWALDLMGPQDPVALLDCLTILALGIDDIFAAGRHRDAHHAFDPRGAKADALRSGSV